MTRTDPAVVWNDAAPVAKGDVRAWCREVDARLAAQTREEARGLFVEGAGAEVAAIATRGFRTAGDGGGGLYAWHGVSEPLDLPEAACLQTADGGWWVIAEPVLRPRMFGAREDGVSDELPALRAMAATSAALGRRPCRYAPVEYRVSAWIDVTEAGPQIGRGHATHIRNIADAGAPEDFWLNTVFFCGTYFGHGLGVPGGTPGSAQNETAFALEDAPRGAREVTLVDPAQAARIAPCDILAIEAPRTYGATPFEEAAVLTRAVAVSGASVTLEQPLRDAYAAFGALKPRLRVLDTGGVVSAMDAATPARLARRPRIEAMRLSQDVETNGQLLHVAAWEGVFRDLWLEGAECLGVNPCAGTLFEGLRVRYRKRALEMAYLSNDNTVRGLHARRVAGGAVSHGRTPVAFTETGGDNLLADFRIESFDFAGDGALSALDISKPRMRVRDGWIVGAQGGGVSFTGTEPYAEDRRARDGQMSGVTIMDPAAHGIDVKSDGVALLGNRVIGTPPGFHAVIVRGGIEGFMAQGNVLGLDGARTARDEIFHESAAPPSGWRVGGNLGVFQALPAVDETGSPLAEISGPAGPADLRAYPIPAGATPLRGAGFDILAFGAVVGVAGAKTLRLALGPETLAARADLPAAASGYWRLEWRIRKLNDGVQWHSARLSLLDAGAGAPGTWLMQGTTNVLMADAAGDLALSVELAAADAVNIAGWSVTPAGMDYRNA